MPIENDKFIPPVVCNSYHNRQIAEWLAGRPVPTMAEMGAKPPLTMSERAARQKVIFSNPSVDTPSMTPPREAIPVRPVNDPSIIPVAKPIPRIIVPARIMPPKKRA